MRVSPALFIVLFVVSWSADAAIRLKDDTGHAITLAAPARRIVSLAPNVTELLFSAGAGERIVGTVEYSDYPAAARAIPRVGGSSGINFESVVALKPDLIVSWAGGNSKRTIARLRNLGFPVFETRSRRLDDIAHDLLQLGRLAGTESVARAASKRFIERYHALAARYAGRPPLRVFYQVLDRQLITVNGEHLISQVLRLCGGVNVFAALPTLAPVVNEEAVLELDPEAIVAGGTDKDWSLWRKHWRERTTMTAVKRGALYLIPADLIHRNTPRVLDGADRICRALQDARRRRENLASSTPSSGAKEFPRDPRHD